jgi:hypothetical protein
LESPRKLNRAKKAQPKRSRRVIQSSSSENDDDQAVIELSDSSPERPIPKAKPPSNPKTWFKKPESGLRPSSGLVLDPVVPLFVDDDEQQNADGVVSILLVSRLTISHFAERNCTATNPRLRNGQ